jgi:hypothetical protein
MALSDARSYMDVPPAPLIVPRMMHVEMASSESAAYAVKYLSAKHDRVYAIGVRRG